MRRSLIVSAVLCAGLAACSSGSTRNMTVSASTASAAGGAPQAGTASIDGGNGITIDTIQIVVSKFEIEGQPACTNAAKPAARSDKSGGPGDSGGSGDPGGAPGSSGSSGSDGDSASDDGECEIESGPFLVSLSGQDLDGQAHPVTGVAVPSGTYDELRFRIDTLTVAQAGTDPGLLAMAQAGASIRIQGTDGTTPFDFRSSIAVSQKREGSIVVDSTTSTNVTLDFDPKGWFQAADGSKLDPASAASAAAIEANIRASVRVVHDDNHDGEDDDHGGGDGSGHGLHAGG